MNREDLTLADIGHLVREATALADEEKSIDLAVASQRPRSYYVLSTSGRDITLPVPADIRELLIKLRKDVIKARLQEIEDLVLPQKR